ncbi:MULTISPECIES: DsbA family protein [Sphingomonas]|uniref:Disulfide bond formation protein DsbA n=1 Tax=Edaphosphingomonas fennica TaxID=114404 RepID=A0A2T4HUE2_9SPHN|nr:MULTISPECIES: DsbA family protein [Sphingomonas]MDX3884936.1 DsbA family protein [Sphingomonas sp.]PTD19387.1 disulfide bond formation protein DsbA [Sphingomonas fennica]
MRFRKRDVLQFGASLLIGSGAAFAFQYFRPIGERVGGSPTIEGILADPDAPRIGPAAPALTIVVFSDYDCPVCRQSYDAMREALAGRRDVRIMFKEWPVLGPNSERAARVALAADRQGIYAAFHERLMRRQGRIDDDLLRMAVEGAGGDWARIESDLAANAPAIDRALARNATEAFALGLSGTPAYLIGPLLVRGGLNEAGFRQAFRDAKR